MKSSLPLADPNMDATAAPVIDPAVDAVLGWTPMIARFDDASLAMTLDRWVTVDLADLEVRVSEFARRSVPAGR